MPRVRCGSRQFGLLSLAFLMGTAFVVCAGPAASPAHAQRVTIMHTNDMHNHLLGFGPEADYTPESTGDDDTVGGMARIAGKVNEIRSARYSEGIPTLLVDGGDFTMGTAFMLLSGAAQIGVMEALGYDAVTLGNHEFDWTPAGTADILSYISIPGVSLPVVASNTNPDPVYLQPLFDGGFIQPYFTRILDNGLKVGFFGLIGEAAVSVAPLAPPVTFGDAVLAAQAMVAALQAAEVDLIVCVSHSGIDEDSALAGLVSGIGVIISGHTHERTPAPVLVGDTVIVQAGDYTRKLGVLDLDLSTVPYGVTYELVDINDEIAGDMDIHYLVQDFVAELNDEVLDDMGYWYDKTMAETDFDLTAPAGVEGNLGNLITDAMRWMVNRYEIADPADIAIESNGVIRDDILKGQSGIIGFSDAFRALPLGIGLDGEVGYPMLTLYMTGSEVKKALELIAIAYPLVGSDYWLNVSGLRYEYMPGGIPFFSVLKIEVGDEESGYVPLDKNATYKIALNYYVSQFIAGIPALIDDLLGIPGIGQLFAIIPKDADGNSYLDPVAHPNGLAEARVDTDPDTPGIQELKQWQGFLDYFATFDDTDVPPNDVPNVPDYYSGPRGRIVETTCFVATAAYGSPLEPRIDILRSFRDRVLKRTEWGRAFVESYYAWGEGPANWISQHAWAQGLVRVLLLPLIGLSKLLVLLLA